MSERNGNPHDEIGPGGTSTICSHTLSNGGTLITESTLLAHMSQSSYDDTIKFRAGTLKEAANELDSIHLGGINISELARAGLTEMLRRTMTDEDKIALYEHYKEDEISEAATRLLLGDEFDMLEEDIEEFAAAAEEDTSQYLA